MAKNSVSTATVLRLCRWHFWLVGVLVVQIIIYHAWRLITPEVVWGRCIAIAVFLSFVLGAWFIAKQATTLTSARSLVYLLIAADIGLASYQVYTQRGMAARAVAMYAVPLIVAAVARRRSILLVTGAISAAAYTATAVSYFIIHFNEGYKIELYGEVGFYVCLIFIAAGLLDLAVSQLTTE